MRRPPELTCRGADFCSELSGRSDTEFDAVYDGDPPTRLIARSGNFTLMADMSPLCIGHLLLVPNLHYLSFAEAIAEHEAEVKDITERIVDQYAQTFGEPLILEHGSSRTTDGSSCITHAHWHLLPIPFDSVNEIIVRDGLDWTDLDGLGELARSARGTTHFLCCDRHRRRLYGSGRGMRRQYLRSVVAAVLGIPDPEWDYAVVVRKYLLRETMVATADWRLGP
jgi:diadenosine tetraphosphate (Ap4A) HIT family hydrolase